MVPESCAIAPTVKGSGELELHADSEATDNERTTRVTGRENEKLAGEGCNWFMTTQPLHSTYPTPIG